VGCLLESISGGFGLWKGRSHTDIASSRTYAASPIRVAFSSGTRSIRSRLASASSGVDAVRLSLFAMAERTVAAKATRLLADMVILAL
jgi:hypothetical protein